MDEFKKVSQRRSRSLYWRDEGINLSYTHSVIPDDATFLYIPLPMTGFELGVTEDVSWLSPFHPQYISRLRITMTHVMLDAPALVKIGGCSCHSGKEKGFGKDQEIKM